MTAHADSHAAAARPGARSHGFVPRWLADLAELTRVRVTLLVTLTTACGYFLFAEALSPLVLLPMAGVFLLACGSSALNQIQETAIDAKMDRTRNRPLPSRRMDPLTAFFIAGTLILAAFAILASIDRHILTVLGLAAFSLVWYNGVYTYAKRWTSFAVVIGALVGAVPPLIGWAAAGGLVFDPFIILVGAFLFIWQVPHFWLLLLMRGDEYERAGLPTPSRQFPGTLLYRVTFLWMAAASTAGVLLALILPVEAWLKAILMGISIWLTLRALIFLAPAPPLSAFRLAFFRVIAYTVAVLVLLSASALT